MQTLTIFTPAYNRADLLPRLYESLLRQSLQDFGWIIVDDGSTDDTEELVKHWQAEGRIQIEYHYKTNGGLHTAYNLGIEKASTELFVCIDSDDFMPDEAVETIINYWRAQGNSDVAGIVGLDYGMDGHPLKNKFLPDVKTVHITKLATKYGFNVDTKIVHRTELLKKVAPMKVFSGEKNFNPIYMFLQIDNDLPLLVLNKNLCFVDYQDTGMANNILSQYVNSPNSFAELRKLNMTLKLSTPAFIFKNAVHYIASCIIARKKNWLSDSPRKLYTIAALPLGVMLAAYLKFKTKN